MMRKFSWMLLLLLAFSVYAEDEKAVVVGSAKELKGITAKKIIWKKDGAVMMSIPATPFDAGKAVYDEFGDLISSVFYMDAHEVTVGQFKEFLKSSGYKPDVSIDWNRVYQYSPNDSHPMVLVTWHDATAYAKWAGKRLPTEKEWEFAARGGLTDKKYSWGNDETQARDYANYEGTGGNDKWGESPAPVGSFKPNGYGLYDIAGNVWEWCQDWYDSDERVRVLRGGSWYGNTGYLRVAARNGNYPNNGINRGGFRCVLGSN